ncbi:hypothetical protein DFH09DRAFT_1128725 [Mycena vulgaris]|nr:hypothetical protein DFH09DRAFT_1128725 [Mycena vulgaris]
MLSFTTFTFDSAKILRSTLRSADERPLTYTTSTVTATAPDESPRTALAGADGTPNAVIDWRHNTFSIGNSTRHVSELRQKRTMFSSSRYWSWFDCEECKVKRQGNMWTVFSYSGGVLATFTPNINRGSRKSLPILTLAASVRDEEERRFIILVLLYSETKRLEGLKQKTGM